MSVELLRRAAKVLREAAEAASAGPWHAHPDGLVWPERIGDPVSGSTEVEDADYIALMHPPVALALADWLNLKADCAGVWPGDMTETDRTALVVARTILREPS